MTTATRPAATPDGGPAAPALRRLHLARASFAVAWAVALALTASPLGAVAAVLLVLYPLVDVGAAVVDARASAARRSALWVDVVVGLAAAGGLAVAVTSGVPAVLRVWGAWAVLAGLVQLVVALRRRGLGGRGAMIASGALSAVAGTAFVLQAAGDRPTVLGLAGYAALGGVFFGVSALRLRAAR
ncbi:membrane protein [Actinomycetospora chlora]|uniref:Membrane protein n=1 Tax=Actinomycetospora chlora TaxID=663608 RepID=A0ABP9BNT8_9PSEU